MRVLTADTSNRFYVRSSPTKGAVIFFETQTKAGVLVAITRGEALNLAAWLTLVSEGDGEIAAIVKEVRR